MTKPRFYEKTPNVYPHGMEYTLGLLKPVHYATISCHHTGKLLDCQGNTLTVRTDSD